MTLLALRRTLKFSGSFGLISLLSCGLVAGHPQTVAGGRRTALVELFTSEGCSSCPPADALLRQLDRTQPVRDVDIIVLGEHVDYWDGLGWKDRFSSKDFTQRQNDYSNSFGLNEVYTPQMVVNGSAQLNGTDGSGIRKAIEKTSAQEDVPLKIAGVTVHGRDVTVTLQDGMPVKPGSVDLYAALVDAAATTEVRAGENGGRTLHHTGVVRTLARVGSSWKTAALGKSTFDVPANLPGSPGSLNGMRLVVFAQTKRLGPVLGATSCVIGGAGDAAFPANACPVITVAP